MVLTMDVSGTYYPVLCAKTAQITVDQEEHETTNLSSTTDREYEPGMASYMLSMTGVTTLDNTNARISAMYLIQQKSTTHAFRATLTDDDGDIRVISFSGFLRTADISRAYAGYSQSAISMRITGTPSFGDPITPPVPSDCEVEDPLYLSVVEGEYIVSDVLLQQTGVEILSVARSGAEHYYTSGTPGSLQYTTNLTSGQIIFSSSIPFNAGEIVYVLYKIN